MRECLISLYAPVYSSHLPPHLLSDPASLMCPLWERGKRRGRLTSGHQRSPIHTHARTQTPTHARTHKHTHHPHLYICYLSHVNSMCAADMPRVRGAVLETSVCVCVCHLNVGWAPVNVSFKLHMHIYDQCTLERALVATSITRL